MALVLELNPNALAGLSRHVPLAEVLDLDHIARGSTAER
jgi:hypothetical protein